MSQTCQRCYKIVARACQSDTESVDCPNLKQAEAQKVARLNAKADTLARQLQ
jgi:hypothetical protein